MSERNLTPDEVNRLNAAAVESGYPLPVMSTRTLVQNLPAFIIELLEEGANDRKVIDEMAKRTNANPVRDPRGKMEDTEAPGGEGVKTVSKMRLVDSDMNGDPFVPGSEGEIEVYNEDNVVVFPPNFHGVASGEELSEIKPHVDDIERFIIANAGKVISDKVSLRDALIIGTVRFLAARVGLVSPNFSTDKHNVRYNEAVNISEEKYREYAAKVSDMVAARNELNDVRRKLIISNFSNYVCCVAFVFRSRGHHYLATLQELYDRLWGKCLKTVADNPLGWQKMSTYALHAIMPDILDDYWKQCAAKQRIAGALIKRLDTAPAGCASAYIVQKGITDVKVVLPTIVRRDPEGSVYLAAVIAQLEQGRWVGSVNARYYGVNKLRIDESKLAALGAIVLGCYETLARTSPLVASPALIRVASNAPILRGVTSRVVDKVVDSSGPALLMIDNQ